MQLTPVQLRSLAALFRQASQHVPDFHSLLKARVGSVVDVDTLDAGLEAVLRTVNALDRAELLLQVLLEMTSLQASARSPFLTEGVLEAVVDPALDWNEATPLLARLNALVRQVCRIEFRTSTGLSPRGTGFLLGPNLLITNHHVVRPLLEGRTRSEDLVARFDYRVDEQGQQLPGIEYSLARDWLVDQSPPAPWEADTKLPSSEPTEEHLDIAVLRLSDSPGLERGWPKLPEQPHPFEKDSVLYILQHPNTKPLKLMHENKAVRHVNAARTRVLYAVNTDQGSSGAPCLNSAGLLVAIHHRTVTHAGETLNEGIPFDTVMRRLAPKLGTSTTPVPARRSEYKPVARAGLVKGLTDKLLSRKTLLLLSPRRGGARTLAEAVVSQAGLGTDAITWLRPPSVEQTREEYFSGLVTGSGVKTPMEWMHWMRAHANSRRHLIVLLHDGGQEEHVDDLGKMIRALFDFQSTRFMFLAAGGERCARLRHNAISSIFTGIPTKHVPDLTVEEVTELLAGMNEDRTLAPLLFRATGGHPGLLYDLLISPTLPTREDEATELLVDGSQLRGILSTRLNRERRNPPRNRTRDVLRKLLAGEQVERFDTSTEDKFEYPEVRLYYDGIVREAPDKSALFRCEAARIVARDCLRAEDNG